MTNALPLDPPLVAILRGLPPEEAPDIGSALHDGGVRWIEAPLNGPRALDSIAALRARLGATARIGAGTALCANDVAAAFDAGADFIVAPNVDPAVIAASKARGLYVMPGCFSPTEALAAIAAGADALKLFPAEALAPAAVKAFAAVLPAHIPLIAVGGVDGAKFAAYLNAGATGFGLGSALYRPGDAAGAVGEKAAALVAAYRTACRGSTRA